MIKKTFRYKLDGSNLIYIQYNIESDDRSIDFKEHSSDSIFEDKDDNHKNNLDDNSNKCVITYF